MVISVRDDSGFQDVPLISWSIKIALNSDQIQLEIMRNAFPHQASWMLLTALAAIRCLHKRVLPSVIGPSSNQCIKIPSVAYLTPCQTFCFVCWCQTHTQQSLADSLRSSLKWPCWKSSYLSS